MKAVGGWEWVYVLVGVWFVVLFVFSFVDSFTADAFLSCRKESELKLTVHLLLFFVF